MSYSIRGYQCASYSNQALASGLEPQKSDGSYVYLRIVPLIHTQRLDLGDVRPQLAMQGCASHAQKDAELQETSVMCWRSTDDGFKRNIDSRCRMGRLTLQLAHPV